MKNKAIALTAILYGALVSASADAEAMQNECSQEQEKSSLNHKRHPYSSDSEDDVKKENENLHCEEDDGSARFLPDLTGARLLASTIRHTVLTFLDEKKDNFFSAQDVEAYLQKQNAQWSSVKTMVTQLKQKSDYGVQWTENTSAWYDTALYRERYVDAQSALGLGEILCRYYEKERPLGQTFLNALRHYESLQSQGQGQGQLQRQTALELALEQVNMLEAQMDALFDVPRAELLAFIQKKQWFTELKKTREFKKGIECMENALSERSPRDKRTGMKEVRNLKGQLEGYAYQEKEKKALWENMQNVYIQFLDQYEKLKRGDSNA